MFFLLFPDVSSFNIFISIPFNINVPEDENTIEGKESQLKEKEIIAKEHLEDMFEITITILVSHVNLLYGDTK